MSETHTYRKCKLCGTRDDAFGCYEKCTYNGPFHEWGDEQTETQTEDAGK